MENYKEVYDEGFKDGRAWRYLFGFKSQIAINSPRRGYADGYIDGFNSTPTLNEIING